MAVKTQFSADELRAILCSYDLGEYIDSQGFDRGADQTNIRITTSGGTYAFRYYEKRPEEYVRFEIGLLHFLGSKSYPCPAPMQRKDGSYFSLHNSKIYVLFSFLDGEHNDNPTNYQLVAPALPQLHNLTLGQKLEFSDARTPYGIDYARSSAEANAKAMADSEEAQARLAWFKAELETINIPNDLPKGVCHCDTNPSNFLYKDGKLSAVLDFDQSAYIWAIYDVAQMIYWWTWPNEGHIQLEESRNLVAQYETVRKLSDDETQHLFDMLKLVHLQGIGWGLGDDSFPNDKRKVVELNTIGRDKFYQAIFG
jgi:homoserine kinase type II